ncbi:hypothetical protein ACH5RR_039434 [Cinchona calisaya]|uniref:Hydroxyproline-rich glycoprotein family protein n=1 Tax=Cinchona calisaya TaxID=153742 RepID=A0ABD2Y002_9GENT
MRGRSSSKQGSKGGLEIDNLDKLKEEPHLSGAYIRSLVKQLTSTRTKDPVNSKDQENLDGDEVSGNTKLTKNGDSFSETQKQSQPPQQPPQHKKQVRRRLHTSRPYQERLLNMAEARREIVTALKFHRAAMKQANEQQQQQQHQHQQLQQENEFQSPLQPLQQEQEGKSKSRRNPRICASNNMTNNFPSYVDNLPCSAFACPPNNYPYYWPLPPVAPPLLPENLNFALPNQPLGLNLNIQDFNDLEKSFYQSASFPSIYSTTSSPSTSSSPPLSVATEEVIPSVAIPQEGFPLVAANAESSMMNYGDSDLHHAVDDKEMAEIRSIGEQHQMEWNDTLNFVTSAWWFKFLKAMEIDPEEKAEEYGNFPFDEVMEFPSWLNANESCLEQHLSDYYSDDYMQDPALPCMEIEEIEGMDGEWLS